MEPSPTSNPRRTSTSPLGQRPLSLGNEPATPSSVLAEFGDEADAGVPSALELAQNVGQSYRRSRPGHVHQSTSTSAHHSGRDRSRDGGLTASSLRDLLVAHQGNLPPEGRRAREALPVSEIVRSFLELATTQARLQSDDDRAAEKYLLYLCIALMAENDELKRELTLMQPQRFA